MAPEDRRALSVVVPVYGEEAHLATCLEAVERELAAAVLASEAEIIVADDATPGGLSPQLGDRHPPPRLLVATRRGGFARNANRGVEAARGDVVCLLNSDMVPLPGFFRGCLDAFRDASVFATTARILEPSGSDAGCKHLRVDGARVELSVRAAADPRARRPGPTPYANGGGSFFRRRTFLELGGFDAAFAPFYWEDVDLGYRAWKRGFRILYDPARALEHAHQATIGRFDRRVVRRIYQRNRRRFVWHNITSVPLPALFARTSLWPTLRALARLRLGRLARLGGDLACLPHAVAVRRAGRRAQVHDDAAVARLWQADGDPSEPPPAGDASRASA